ncbi:MAG: transcriptional repressor LexA [Gammaproteobacteria bacterium]|nr:transcriptional repressor LexA [Gammaproteobacteria bacterium]|tara:strand:- start:396 stop:1004 length:609 start_codon:yes stop_codon:yes gene_type:complete
MLTSSEKKTLKFIQKYCIEKGYSPTLTEIAKGIGIKSKGVVHRYIKTLESLNLISISSHRKRGIVLNLEAYENQSVAPIIPLLGRIAAGQPIEAIEGREEINLADFIMNPDRFALQVSGDSMIEAGILDGDTVIIKHQNTAENGDIIVALIDGLEATLKRLKKLPDGMILLIPENKLMEGIIYEAKRIQIQGVVVGQLRSYQ